MDRLRRCAAEALLLGAAAAMAVAGILAGTAGSIHLEHTVQFKDRMVRWSKR